MGDLSERTRGDLLAILWREKRGIHVAPTEGNFINEQGTAMKLLIL
jgi:hypothetical protein